MYTMTDTKDQPPATFMPATDSEQPKKSRRWTWIIAAVVVIVVLGAVLGGVLGTKLKKSKSKGLPPRLGIHVMTTRVGGRLDQAKRTVLYTSEAGGDITWRYLENGKASENPGKNIPKTIFNISTANPPKPVAHTPLTFCELNNPNDTNGTVRTNTSGDVTLEVVSDMECLPQGLHRLLHQCLQPARRLVHRKTKPSMACAQAQLQDSRQATKQPCRIRLGRRLEEA